MNNVFVVAALVLTIVFQAPLPVILGLAGLAALLYLYDSIMLFGMFKKMELPMPLAFVPGLNLFLLYRRAWNLKPLFWMIVSMIITAAFGFPVWVLQNNLVLVLLIMFGSATVVVILWCIFGLSVELSGKFGKKLSHGVLLFFLPTVFLPELAFGKAVYTQKQKEAVYAALDETVAQ